MSVVRRFSLGRNALPGLIATAFLAVAVPVTAAGEYNPTLSVGDAAPAWSDLPGVDGRKHALADLKDKAVVVVVFSCNSCDASTAYEPRIAALVEQHCGPEGKGALVAINVNKIPEDSLAAMQRRHAEKPFTYPYLYDETQAVAKAYGATFTPEFFVLDAHRRIVYMGALDDASPPAEVKTKYVEEAIEAALSGGKPKVGETVARGCMVRYEKKRRERPAK